MYKSQCLVPPGRSWIFHASGARGYTTADESQRDGYVFIGFSGVNSKLRTINNLVLRQVSEALLRISTRISISRDITNNFMPTLYIFILFSIALYSISLVLSEEFYPWRKVYPHLYRFTQDHEINYYLQVSLNLSQLRDSHSPQFNKLMNKTKNLSSILRTNWTLDKF